MPTTSLLVIRDFAQAYKLAAPKGLRTDQLLGKERCLAENLRSDRSLLHEKE